MRAALAAEFLPPRPPMRHLTGRRLNLERAEKAAIHRALEQAGGNVALAARALGISRSTLYRKGIRYGITLSARRRTHLSVQIPKFAALKCGRYRDTKFFIFGGLLIPSVRRDMRRTLGAGRETGMRSVPRLLQKPR